MLDGVTGATMMSSIGRRAMVMQKLEFVAQSTQAALMFEAVAREVTCPIHQAKLRAAARKVRFRARLALWGVPVIFLDPFRKPKPFERKLVARLKADLTGLRAGQVSHDDVKNALFELIGVLPGDEVDHEVAELFDLELRAFCRDEIPLKIAINSFASVIESERHDRAASARK